MLTSPNYAPFRCLQASGHNRGRLPSESWEDGEIAFADGIMVPRFRGYDKPTSHNALRIEVGAAVAEEAPIGAVARDLVEIEGVDQDAFLLLAE
jgi:hypothetical protein